MVPVISVRYDFRLGVFGIFSRMVGILKIQQFSDIPETFRVNLHTKVLNDLQKVTFRDTSSCFTLLNQARVSVYYEESK